MINHFVTAPSIHEQNFPRDLENAYKAGQKLSQQAPVWEK